MEVNEGQVLEVKVQARVFSSKPHHTEDPLRKPGLDDTDCDQSVFLDSYTSQKHAQFVSDVRLVLGPWYH